MAIVNDKFNFHQFEVIRNLANFNHESHFGCSPLDMLKKIIIIIKEKDVKISLGAGYRRSARLISLDEEERRKRRNRGGNA